MDEDRTKQTEYFEALVQNAQKGEYYLIKLKGDPIEYTAIPLIHYNMDTQKDSMFVMKVVEPPEHQGVYKQPVNSIEKLERKP